MRRERCRFGVWVFVVSVMWMVTGCEGLMIPLDSSEDEATEAQEERYSVHPVQEAVPRQNDAPPPETEAPSVDREQETAPLESEAERVAPEPREPGQGGDPGDTADPESVSYTHLTLPTKA